MSESDWKFVFEAIKAIAAVIAVLSGLLAVWSFYYFRRRMPKLSLSIAGLHERAAEGIQLYVTVTVTNLDSIKVQGDWCSVAIRPLVGAQLADAVAVRAIMPTGQRSIWTVPKEDADSIWVLDKDESNTFCFGATLPLGAFGCLVQADYRSRKLKGEWLAPPAFGWRRDQMLDLKSDNASSAAV